MVVAHCLSRALYVIVEPDGLEVRSRDASLLRTSCSCCSKRAQACYVRTKEARRMRHVEKETKGRQTSKATSHNSKVALRHAGHFHLFAASLFPTCCGPAGFSTSVPLVYNHFGNASNMPKYAALQGFP